jgi:hypothetical protein
MVLVQGSMYYKAKGGSRFLGSESNKVLALQLAEAGVEENIADLGTRAMRIRPGLADTVTYDGKAMGGGSFTTTLSTVATGPSADTIDLVSVGSLGKNSQTIRARMKLKNFMDTSRTPLVLVAPETTLTLTTRTVADTDTVVTAPNIAAIPAMGTTQAYQDCQSGSKKCKLCHLPGGDPSKAHPITISKNAVKTHLNEHGDYIASDSDVDCDLYDPVTTYPIWYSTKVDTTRTIVDKTTYDTAIVVDTLVKIHILSWK